MTGSLAGTGPLLRLAWRRDRWIILASVLALVATAYGSMVATLDLYPTDAEAAAGAAVMTDNPSLTALYGPLPSATAAGIGVLKTVMMGSLFTAFLAFAIVRRHTRSEEEDGRFELVAAGVVGRRAPLAAAVVLATGTVLATGVLSALSLVGTGVDATGSFALGAVEVVAGVVMVGITAIAVQLTSTTRGAGGIAIGVLGLAFVVRALADTATGGAATLSGSPSSGGRRRSARSARTACGCSCRPSPRPPSCSSSPISCSTGETSVPDSGPPARDRRTPPPGSAARSVSRGASSAARCSAGPSGMPCWAWSSATSPSPWTRSRTAPASRRCCAR